jgi:hypothetical protein
MSRCTAATEGCPKWRDQRAWDRLDNDEQRAAAGLPRIRPTLCANDSGDCVCPPCDCEECRSRHATIPPAGALEVANGYRMEQARLKRELRAGNLPLERVLLAGCMQGLRLFEVLRHLPTRGKVRRDDLAGELIGGLGCAPLARVRDLTERQRVVLGRSYQMRIPGL